MGVAKGARIRFSFRGRRGWEGEGLLQPGSALMYADLTGQPVDA